MDLKKSLLLLVLAWGVFFWKMGTGKVPVPLDSLVGVYYPWLNQKWGFPAGVPVKNPALTDVIAQYYPWRKIAVDQMRKLEIPLWNPYSFSGTPLLGNWQSAVFYPLNILLVLFGDLWGWSLLISAQMLISSVGMLLFLKKMKLDYLSAMAGALVYSYGGFMLIFLTYGSPAQTAAWLPWLMWSVAGIVEESKKKFFGAYSLCVLMMILAGNFQVTLYGVIFSLAYFIFLSKTKLRVTDCLKILFFLGLGVGMGAIYLLPVFEFLQNSIRNLDLNIMEYNFGLIPLKAMVTFLAPDYFGNPATGNFRGFIYHETSFYFGVTAIPLVMYGFWSENRQKLFFLIAGILALLMVFDTPLGRLPFVLKIPFISTSYASRANIIFQMCAAVMCAIGVESVLKTKRKMIFYSSVVFLCCCMVFGYLSGMRWLGWNSILWDEKYIISWKNLIFPVLASGGLLAVSVLFWRVKRILVYCVLAIICIDLFRFGWKYTPFVNTTFDFPKTSSIEFLKNNLGNYRMERERAEIMPSNTWAYYNLMSPSGYDPLLSLNYARLHKAYNGNDPSEPPVRYLEMEKPDSNILDLLGVKYILALKRIEGVPNPDGTLPVPLQNPKFVEVFSEDSVSVLENKKVMPRASVYFDWEVDEDLVSTLNKMKVSSVLEDKMFLEKKPSFLAETKKAIAAELVEYGPEKIIIRTTSLEKGGVLFLSDSFYPGWKVKVNGVEREVLRAFGSLRAVIVDHGVNQVIFEYKPKSFEIGAIIALLSLVVLITYANSNKFTKLALCNKAI